MKIGEIVRAQEPKMPQGVECESFKDFKDFIIYCDVMNWHPDEKPYTYRGVATMELDHGVFGIFDAITNTNPNGEKTHYGTMKLTIKHRQSVVVTNIRTGTELIWLSWILI